VNATPIRPCGAVRAGGPSTGPRTAPGGRTIRYRGDAGRCRSAGNGSVSPAALLRPSSPGGSAASGATLEPTCGRQTTAPTLGHDRGGRETRNALVDRPRSGLTVRVAQRGSPPFRRADRAVDGTGSGQGLRRCRPLPIRSGESAPPLALLRGSTPNRSAPVVLAPSGPLPRPPITAVIGPPEERLAPTNPCPRQPQQEGHESCPPPSTTPPGSGRCGSPAAPTAGHHLITVTLRWVCPVCGGPRGEVHPTISYDGSRRLGCDGWTNPCGHLDTYDAIRLEAAAEAASATDAQQLPPVDRT
jgi:hypothetical protein